MELYFSPLACSMSARIAFYEANADVTFIEVDGKTKKTLDGADYLAINSLGLVPALRLDGGEVLTENAAILQYIVELYPDAALAPASGLARAGLQRWLSFVGTELHKALFIPLLDKSTSKAMKSQALTKGANHLAYLDKHLAGRTFLLDTFSVADAYLFTVLNWNIATPVDLKQWPAIAAYYEGLKQRPSVARALKEEFALYTAEQARRKAA